MIWRKDRTGNFNKTMVNTARHRRQKRSEAYNGKPQLDFICVQRLSA
jgi:hypothetical protein